MKLVLGVSHTLYEIILYLHIMHYILTTLTFYASCFMILYGILFQDDFFNYIFETNKYVLFPGLLY